MLAPKPLPRSVILFDPRFAGRTLEAAGRGFLKDPSFFDAVVLFYPSLVEKSRPQSRPPSSKLTPVFLLRFCHLSFYIILWGGLIISHKFPPLNPTFSFRRFME